MAKNELDGRALVNPQLGAMPPSGSDRAIWQVRDAQAFTEALVSIPERVHLFAEDGGLKVLLDGEVQVLNAERLHRVIRENCVTKHLVTREGKLEIEFQPAEAGAMVLQEMLRNGKNEGGLRGRVPDILVEAPRQAPPPPQEPPSNHPEAVAGRRTAARWAELGSDARLQEEIAAGQRTTAKHRAQGQPGSNPAADS
jgi:hypothetical protein